MAARKEVTEHKVEELTITPGKISAIDPFIYNPFAKKKGKDLDNIVVLPVEHEPMYVDIVLLNPFSFDIPIRKLELCTSGVKFKTFPVTLIVAANAHSHSVRLGGIPLEPGVLQIQ